MVRSPLIQEIKESDPRWTERRERANRDNDRSHRESLCQDIDSGYVYHIRFMERERERERERDSGQ